MDFSKDDNIIDSNLENQSYDVSSPFSCFKFIYKPQVITRLIGIFCSIIIFSCIITQGWEKDICKYQNNSGACNYGTGLGVFTFILLIVFLLLDAYFDQVSNVSYKKYLIIADLLIAGFMTFLWLVCFSNMADKWRKTTEEQLKSWGGGRDAMQAAIAFSFFLLISFVGLTILAFRRYKDSSSDSSQYNDHFSNADQFTP